MLAQLTATLLPMSTTGQQAASVGMSILIIVASIAYLALFIGALVSIVRSDKYTTGMKALWILICFIAPFVGSLVWFLFGRKG
ncbi:PLD nuclease N-terminal domain-containing protein [Actinomyces minihominis]|uniref:PLD nuclease N-terminal domain-containing protein n=1 Tax=Actinomyces minihominis TaxID=2002838 RepID=UPI001A935D1F|nr:PLD nuclease N-terminal domain-containing protein [Actinomyces minihominis]